MTQRAISSLQRSRSTSSRNFFKSVGFSCCVAACQHVTTVWQRVYTNLRFTILEQLCRKWSVVYVTEQAGNQQSENQSLEAEMAIPEDEIAVDGYDDQGYRLYW